MINRDIDFYNNPIGNNISSSWNERLIRKPYSKFQISEFPDYISNNAS